MHLLRLSEDSLKIISDIYRWGLVQDRGHFEALKEDRLRRPAYGPLRSTEGPLRPTEDFRKRADSAMNPAKRMLLHNIL